jgi:tRNA A64-2'-O-ribosylphosphate transferase
MLGFYLGLDIDLNLYTPPNAVSENEREQIMNHIPQFVEKLKVCLRGWSIDSQKTQINFPQTLKNMKKPLRPIWITPTSTLFQNGNPWDIETLDFYPVILISASEAIPDGYVHKDFLYVQGSADDEEMWSKVLHIIYLILGINESNVLEE